MRLYMEVETAQQSVSRLLDSALQWQAELFRLRQSLSQLTGSWQGPSADAFFLDADGLLGALTEAGWRHWLSRAAVKSSSGFKRPLTLRVRPIL